MRKIQFVTGSFYHLYNRGVDKRRVFLTPRDYRHFLDQATLLNSITPLQLSVQRTSETPASESATQDLLVDVVAFCLMPNHYHFLVRQRQDKGISEWMQRLGTAYTMYFNMKYKRSGRLFQSTFKAITIDSDTYLRQLTCYIHLNPIEMFSQSEKAPSWHDIKSRLLTYQWSNLPSFLDDADSPFPRLSLGKKYVLEQFPEPKPLTYERFLADWATRDADELGPLTLEEEKLHVSIKPPKAKPWEMLRTRKAAL